MGRKPRRRPERCESYFAGHNAHWIQALTIGRTAERVPARVVRTYGLALAIEARGEQLVYLHHNTPRLERAIATYGPDALLQQEGSLLLIPEPDGALACFSILHPRHEWKPCVFEHPRDQRPIDDWLLSQYTGLELLEIDARVAYEKSRPRRDIRIASGKTTPTWEALQWAHVLDLFGPGFDPKQWPEEAALIDAIDVADT